MRLRGKSSRQGTSKLFLIMRSHDQDVIETLPTIAENILNTTGFFHNGLKPGNENESGNSLQNGVSRMNCIDSLDRTNAAQFVIGKRVLGTRKRLHLRQHHLYSPLVSTTYSRVFTLCALQHNRTSCTTVSTMIHSEPFWAFCNYPCQPTTRSEQTCFISCDSSYQRG